MAERTDLQTMSGAVLAISATLPATYDAAGYGATGMVYTTVGSIEDFGEAGPTANVSPFIAVADGVTQKFKGAIDHGTRTLVIGNIPGDAGQDILLTASTSKARYSVKITYPVGTGESTGEIHYLNVLVTRFARQDGSVDNVRRVTVDLSICRAPTIVDAT